MSEVVCIQALVDGKFSAQATGWLVRGDRLVTVSTVLVEGAEVVAIAPDGHVPLNLVQRDSASGLVVLQPVDTLDNHLFLDAITAKPHDRWRAPGFPDGSTQRTYIGDVVDPETAGELLELKSDEALGELGGLQGAPVLVTEHVVGVVVRADGNRIWAADATKALDRLGLLADATPPARPPVADAKATKHGRLRKRRANPTATRGASGFSSPFASSATAGLCPSGASSSSSDRSTSDSASELRGSCATASAQMRGSCVLNWPESQRLIR